MVVGVCRATLRLKSAMEKKKVRNAKSRVLAYNMGGNNIGKVAMLVP
jgi:hypothetical protein